MSIPASTGSVMLLAAMVSGLAASALAQDSGLIVGTVRDPLGQPIRDALVTVDPDSARTTFRMRTDAEGQFRFTRVPSGRHELQVVRLAFAPHYSTVEVGTDDVRLTIEMQPIPLRLDSVVVRAARSGVYGTVATRGWELMQHDPRPLRGATIEVLDSPYRRTTSADGRFAIPDLREGAYTLLVRLDRYASRVVSVYVPPDGGVDVTVVLDSVVADYQRRDDYLMRDMSRRLRQATYPSTLVPMAELAGPPGRSLKDALRAAPSAITRGLLLLDEVTCVYLNGSHKPRMTAADILAEDVQAVEVYGVFARGGTVAPEDPWRPGELCGTGMFEGPQGRLRQYSDNIARVIVIWTRRRR